jgi:phosphoribosylanthranilate isomerase
MIRVKICGVTSIADAEAACQAGADLIGLNFYEKSPRRVSEADAEKVRAVLPGTVQAVGIFVNVNPSEVVQTCRLLRLDAAQLHGDESPEVVASVARDVRVFKALQVSPDFAVDSLRNYPAASAFLLDAWQAGQYGGTGQTIDWSLARQVAAAHRIILAGGLNAENVGDAIRAVRPYGVDVASGVESKPGKKDHAKLREFIEKVRRAEKQLEAQAERSNAS